MATGPRDEARYWRAFGVLAPDLVALQETVVDDAGDQSREILGDGFEIVLLAAPLFTARRGFLPDEDADWIRDTRDELDALYPRSSATPKRASASAAPNSPPPNASAVSSPGLPGPRVGTIGRRVTTEGPKPHQLPMTARA